MKNFRWKPRKRRPKENGNATLAAFCHNADRVVQVQLGVGRRDVPEESVRLLISEWLSHTPISDAQRNRVTHAVMGHCNKTLSGEDLVVTALRDADRLANIQPDVIVRSAQHYPEYPAVHPIYLAKRTPEGTYFEPGSVFADLNYMATKWDPDHPEHDPDYCVVLPKARELARPHFEYLRDYIARGIEARRQVGLVPYPKFD